MTTNSVSRISRSLTQDIVEALVFNGCCITTNFIDASTVDKVYAEVRSFLDPDNPREGDRPPPGDPAMQESLQPERDRGRDLVGGSADSGSRRYVLDREHEMRYRESGESYQSEAQVTMALTLEIGSGAEAQKLHRDDKNNYQYHGDQSTPGYILGSDVMLDFMIPGIATTEQNGATFAITGSRLWGPDRPPQVEEVVTVELEVVSALCGWEVCIMLEARNLLLPSDGHCTAYSSLEPTTGKKKTSTSVTRKRIFYLGRLKRGSWWAMI